MNKAFALIAVACLGSWCHASLPQKINSALGSIYHAAQPISSVPLNTSEQQMVEEVKTKLGVTKVTTACKILENPSKRLSRPLSSGCAGSKLYLAEKDLIDSQLRPPFIMAHEMMHAEKLHSTKLFSRFLITWGLIYFLLIIYESKLSHKCAPLRKVAHIIPGIPALLLQGVAAYLITTAVMPFMLGSLSRSHELEADREAFERLSQYYDKEAIWFSARHELVGPSRSLDFGNIHPILKPIHKLTISHPSTRDRLKALGITKEVSKDAAHKFTLALKHYIHDYLEHLKTKSNDALTNEALHIASNFENAGMPQNLIAQAYFASIDQDVAQNLKAQLCLWKEMIQPLGKKTDANGPIDSFHSSPFTDLHSSILQLYHNNNNYGKSIYLFIKVLIVPTLEAIIEGHSSHRNIAYNNEPYVPSPMSMC